MLTKLFILAALVLCIATGCTHTATNPATTTPAKTCDTANMSYTTNILPIIKANCYACHSGTAFNGGGIHLDSYTTLYEKCADEASLLPAINHQPGYPPMPYPKGSAKISDCDINQITAWVNQGAKNN